MVLGNHVHAGCNKCSVNDTFVILLITSLSPVSLRFSGEIKHSVFYLTILLCAWDGIITAIMSILNFDLQSATIVIINYFEYTK